MLSKKVHLEKIFTTLRERLRRKRYKNPIDHNTGSMTLTPLIDPIDRIHWNILNGNPKSKTATKLVREWVDLHQTELEKDWQLAQEGKEIKKIDPLD